jgi:ribosomal protein RSM22 (predicted rRNA methylase)
VSIIERGVPTQTSRIATPQQELLHNSHLTKAVLYGMHIIRPIFMEALNGSIMSVQDPTLGVEGRLCVIKKDELCCGRRQR